MLESLPHSRFSIRTIHFSCDTVCKIYDILNYKFVDTMDLLCLCFIWNGKLYPILNPFARDSRGRGIFLAFFPAPCYSNPIVCWICFLWWPLQNWRTPFIKTKRTLELLLALLHNERKCSSSDAAHHVQFFLSNNFLVNCNYILKVFPRIIRSHALEIYCARLRFNSSEHAWSCYCFFLRN